MPDKVIVEMKKSKKPRAIRLKFAAIEIPTETDTKFYVSAIPVSVLAKVSLVSRAEEDPEKGYQRLLSKGRLRQICVRHRFSVGPW